MATAKSCEELQLIGISNNTFKVRSGNETVSTFCGESGKHLITSILLSILGFLELNQM